MEFRKAAYSDINCIMEIIMQAQAYLSAQGINQWQNNYPNIDVIKKDIDDKDSYVLLKDEKIVGTAAVSFKGEKNYQLIYSGKWIGNNEYAVIHRIAIDSYNKGLGLSSEIIKSIEEMCLSKAVYSIRVDTHKENLSMQRMLQKNSFQYCGIIHLADKSERIAFEKIIGTVLK